MFLSFDRYDFGSVGRYKLNKRFGEDFDQYDHQHRTLKPKDLVNVIKEIIRLNISQKSNLQF